MYKYSYMHYCLQKSIQRIAIRSFSKYCNVLRVTIVGTALRLRGQQRLRGACCIGMAVGS